MAKLVMTKVCRVCGREFYWKTVEKGEILDFDVRVETINKCPYCGSPLDYNFHVVADRGEGRKVVTFVKRCPACGFEVKLMKMSGGRIIDLNRDAENLVLCPVCGKRLTVEAHDLIV